MLNELLASASQQSYTHGIKFGLTFFSRNCLFWKYKAFLDNTPSIISASFKTSQHGTNRSVQPTILTKSDYI